MRTFCIIGDPVNHSLSPAMHNAAFKSLNLDYLYIAYRVTSSELEASIASLRSVKVAGFNVTIPHKTKVIGYLEEVDGLANSAGAVNTVVNLDGRFKGYNTDVQGFIQPLFDRGIDLCGKSVLLFGAGGSARAVVTALSNFGDIHKLVIADRTPAKCSELATIAHGNGLKCSTANLEDAKKIARDFDLIINATPIGLQSDESVLNSENIARNSIVYDLVYRPVLTKLIENAREKGAVVIYGYEMLLEQGARAFEIWTGLKPPMQAMKKALFGIFQEPK
jgi:shikimate dehydrogenase